MRSFFLTLFSLVCFAGIGQVDQFQQDIIDYLNAKGTETSYNEYYDDMFKSLKKNFENSEVPQSVWADLKKDKAKSLDEIISFLSFAYRKQFTHAEIKGMKEFYQTKAGQKFIGGNSGALSKREDQAVTNYFESSAGQKEADVIPLMKEDIKEIEGHWRRDLFAAKMKQLLMLGYVPEQ